MGRSDALEDLDQVEQLLAAVARGESLTASPALVRAAPSFALRPSAEVAAFACCPCGLGLVRGGGDSDWRCPEVEARYMAPGHLRGIAVDRVAPAIGRYTTRELAS